MASATGQAVFAVVAKDAASNVIHGIGKSMGGLRSAAGAAFKTLVAGAVAAAGALAALGIAAIKAAAEDQRATILLSSALQQRGFNLAKLQPLIDKQIQSMQRLGFTDDQVRSGLEVGSRFFKNQKTLLSANSAAANVAAVTGKSLADVMMIIGKASQGQMRGLKSLGIELNKNATDTEIVAAINAKFGGVADQLAESVGGKAAAAQIRFNEAVEKLGYDLLPVASDALDFIATEVLPRVEGVFETVGQGIKDFAGKLSEKGGVLESVDKVVGPIRDKLGAELGKVGDKFGTLFTKVTDLVGLLWGDGKGPLAIAVSAIGGAFELFLGTVNLVLDAVNLLIDAINTVIRLFNSMPTNVGGGLPSPGGAGGNYGAMPPVAPVPSGSGYLNGYVSAQNINLTIGTKAQSDLSMNLGLSSNATGSTRNSGNH